MVCLFDVVAMDATMSAARGMCWSGLPSSMEGSEVVEDAVEKVMGVMLRSETRSDD